MRGASDIGCRCGKWDKGSSDKIAMKAHFIMKNQEELDITDEQIAKIKDIKVEYKKNKLKMEADIDIIAVDINSLMYEDAVNTEAINKLIDQKYEIKKAKAKAMIDSYAKLKAVLTKDQLKDMKSLWYKGGSCSSCKVR